MSRNLKPLLNRVLSIFIGIFLLSGCHTVEGLGQDMQEGGHELQKAATNSSSS